MAERDLASTVIFRQVGSTQPIIMGNAFDTGTDNYLANKAADIAVVHSYMDGPRTAMGAMRRDTTGLGSPVLAEEFGWFRGNTFGSRGALASALARPPSSSA